MKFSPGHASGGAGGFDADDTRFQRSRRRRRPRTFHLRCARQLRETGGAGIFPFTPRGPERFPPIAAQPSTWTPISRDGPEYNATLGAKPKEAARRFSFAARRRPTYAAGDTRLSEQFDRGLHDRYRQFLRDEDREQAKAGQSGNIPSTASWALPIARSRASSTPNARPTERYGLNWRRDATARFIRRPTRRYRRSTCRRMQPAQMPLAMGDYSRRALRAATGRSRSSPRHLIAVAGDLHAAVAVGAESTFAIERANPPWSWRCTASSASMLASLGVEFGAGIVVEGATSARRPMHSIRRRLRRSCSRPAAVRIAAAGECRAEPTGRIWRSGPSGSDLRIGGLGRRQLDLPLEPGLSASLASPRA